MVIAAKYFDACSGIANIANRNLIEYDVTGAVLNGNDWMTFKIDGRIANDGELIDDHIFICRYDHRSWS